ncbi:MAG: alpha/beta fold hydrolase [Pseudomonadota bacterium]
MLSYQRFGADQGGRPILIAHGLFGSGRNWGAIAKRLAQTRPVTTVDMRNHGSSFRAPTQSYEEMAADLAEVIRDHDGPMDVLGHSMGGKAAMALALTEPERVARLIVGDIAPVSYGHSHSGYIAAMRALDLSSITRRSEADRALRESIDDAAQRAFLLQSLQVTDGRAVWLLNLDALDAAMPQILDFPTFSTSFDRPALFVSGSESAYVTAEHRPAIRALFPAARFVAIKGAGHWLHADNPNAFVEVVEGFLGR